MKSSRVLFGAAVAATLIALATGCAPPSSHPASQTATANKPVTRSENTAEPSVGGTSLPAINNSPSVAAGSVKQVHSPGAVAIDEQLTPGQCNAKDLDAADGLVLPDVSCTPGAIDPAVTQDNIATTICSAGGYTSTIRPPAAETDKFKATVLRAYGQSPNKTTELDHLISLELGGTNSATNLWPEPNKASAISTTNPKDAVEDTLHKAVCDHRVKLTDAQNAIAHNWTTAVKDLGL